MKIFSGQAKATKTIPDAVFAEGVAQMLADRLRDVTRRDFADALWVGADTPMDKNIARLDRRDIAFEGENERFPFPEASLDLIVVNGALHTLNDLPGALVQMRRALKPDGLFLAALPGGETHHALRESLMRVEAAGGKGAAARMHPTIDLQSWAALLQRAGFALPVADTEAKTIFYKDFKRMLRDIKNSGEGLRLAQSPPYPGHDFWDAVAADYQERHQTPDGLLPARIEILFGIGWGPAESQQKPQRPGTAQQRLADALQARGH
ncbi:MAG: methyltransferase domain-containing protein [Alphaproteobacteria bacterium]|nr:methyltransferase domain-containing protein [Alphaproteobacteria bacterium]USO07440.1 MAG: methyltransferase domain-containing protein [Rhodospirillales bacterium]